MEKNPGETEITIFEKNEFPLWNEFIYNSPQGSFFNSTDWAEILSEVFNRNFKLAVYRKKDRIIAGSVYFENRRGFLKMITAVPLFPVNALIYYRPSDENPHKTIANYQAIDQMFIPFFKHNYHFWILESHFSRQDIRAFQWAGCKSEPLYDYLIDLKINNKLNDLFSQGVRKKIRNAEKQKIKIIESKNYQIFSRLYEESYRRHGILPLISNEQMKKLLEKIIQLEQVKLFYAEKNENILAGRIVLTDRETVYDLLAGSDDETGLASTYLVASILKKYSAVILIKLGKPTGIITKADLLKKL